MTESQPDRVLFVAHDFPPASGSGANRALAMARYLPNHGWRPTVLTTGVAWAVHPDTGLLASIPRDARVVRTRSLEPRPSVALAAGDRPRPTQQVRRNQPVRTGALRSHLGHARRFPDAHRGWIPFAVAAGMRSARAERPGALYSTAGPFSSHVVGLVLQRLTRLPWVAELRDGWYQWNRAIFPDYPSWRDVLERRLERAVVRSAARVVLVTEQMAAAYRAQYPDVAADHFCVVPNGFDPAQYAGLPAYESRPGRFEVVHAGSLYYGRSVESFLEGAGRVSARSAEFKAAFRLTLLGTLDERARDEVGRQAARWGLERNVVYRGYVEHLAALAAMRQADLLLLLTNTTSGAEATVPGKLFEYLAVGRPILAITPPGATGEAIVRETRSGHVAPAHDVEAITRQLEASFQQHVAGRPFHALADAIARYDRRAQAAQLAGILDTISGRTA